MTHIAAGAILDPPNSMAIRTADSWLVASVQRPNVRASGLDEALVVIESNRAEVFEITIGFSRWLDHEIESAA